MALSEVLKLRLASALFDELDSADIGHCLRIDDLDQESAVQVCLAIRQLAPVGHTDAFVLGATPEVGVMILPEKAIELRNRKRTRMCLFVPAGFGEAAASSLSNSFAPVDLQLLLTRIADQMVQDLPQMTRVLVNEVKGQLRSPMRPSPERWAEFMAEVASSPQPERVGEELWRIGLIPDLGPDGIAARLSANRRCSLSLVRPSRAQSSAVERLDGLGLKAGAVRDQLRTFCAGKRLRDTRSWMPELLREPHRGRVTFERWSFEATGTSDLVSIDVNPLVDHNGVVEKATKLIQPNGPGSQPVANVGLKRSVGIRWSCDPAQPVNLSRWQVELVASRLEYSEEEAAGADLPSTRSAAKSRRASVSLDIDLESLPVRAVQVRVTGLDQFGSELRGPDNEPIEGISDEFWLSDEQVLDIDPGSLRADLAPTLAFARLKAAAELPITELEEGPGQWIERDLHYFGVTLGGRRISRIGLSPILRQIEQRIIANPDETGCYRAEVDVADQLSPDGLRVGAGHALWDSPTGSQLLAKRRDLFKLIARQEHRGLVETAQWSPELSRRVRAYAAAYLEVLSAGRGSSAQNGTLQLDTLQLDVGKGTDAFSAVLIAPTHPMRLLWYAAYSDLLSYWERELLGLTRNERRRVLDLSLLERVSPLNTPFLSIDGHGAVAVFSQNLSVFWGLSLPAYAPDATRWAADVARVIGLPESEAKLSGLSPSRVADELQLYRDVHPYLSTLRLSLINLGSGSFVAEALRQFLSPDLLQVDDERPSKLPRLDVMVHVETPAPSHLRPLLDLQANVYDAQPIGRRRYLQPLVGIAMRKLSESLALPGGDVDISIITHLLRPEISLTDDPPFGDSSSFYGLLVRLIPTFTSSEDGSTWHHQITLPSDAARERHPVYGPYTDELVDLHREYLKAIGRSLGAKSESSTPSIRVSMSPDERIVIDRYHHESDWVITVDRFFGVEFFDDPADADLSRVARKYLIDYAPEFLEGLGHHMLVTTSHREEVAEVLQRAMHELGFGLVEESVGEVLEHLKKISGRLALKVIGDDSHAREAVSLGVVAAYMRARGELDDAILIPVDAHPDLFGVAAAGRPEGAKRERCDLIKVRFVRGRVIATFIEVKARSAAQASDELMQRMVDQISATEEVFRELFFRKEAPVRLDRTLQRSRLTTILNFYLNRAARHGLITSGARLEEINESIRRLEAGNPDFRSEKLGFIVNLAASEQPPVKMRGAEIHFLSARDLGAAGFSSSFPSIQGSDSDSMRSDEERPKTRSARSKPVDARAPGDEAQADRQDLESAAKGSGDGGGKAGIGDAADVAAVAPELEDGEPDNERSEEGTSNGLADAEQAPASSSQPVASGPDFSVDLGLTVGDQDPAAWKPSVRGSPHLFVVGIPGQGKSWTVTRILEHLSSQGLPPLVIDFHGQFGNESTWGQSARPVLVDAAKGLPFSPFEADTSPEGGASYWRTNCFAVAEIFQYVCELGDMQRDVVYEALRDCYQANGFESGATAQLPSVAQVQARLEQLELDRKVKNVVARCRPLLEFGLFKEGDTDRFDLRETLAKTGLVVDVRNMGLETLQLAAGAFLLRKVYKDMFKWGEAEHLRLAIVLDEAHRLARDITLPKIMKEGRKFGIAVIVASQGLADYHPDVVGNAGTKVVFRTNFPMSKKVAGFLRARKGVDLAEAIEQLDVGYAYIQTPDMPTCVQVKMHPLEGPT